MVNKAVSVDGDDDDNCYDPTLYVPPNVYAKALIPSVMVIGGRAIER